MPGLSNAVENKLLDQLCGGSDYTVTSPTLALVTAAVLETDTASSITRPTYTGYADISVDNATQMNAASGGAKTNSADLAFPTNTGATTSNIVGFALLNGSDVVLFGTISPTYAAGPGVTPRFDPGTLTLTAD